MRIPAGVLLLLTLACACDRTDDEVSRVADVVLPPSDRVTASVPAGATAADLTEIIEVGLRTERKGPDYVRFVVIRAGDRHGTNYRANEFHVVIGAGINLPAGSMRIQRSWMRPGMVDGVNEPPQNFGIAVVVEPGAAQPFSDAVSAAARAFCGALSRRIPIHPDCVVAMQEIPYTNAHEADPHERALAAAARAVVPIPAADMRITITNGAGVAIPIACEHRRTFVGRQVGLMLRRGFDGTDRGMLFEYDYRSSRNFWMFNCLMPIDLAYIKKGRIEQILTMEATPRIPTGELRRYQSNTAVKWVLEMPSGWFDAKGVKVGDLVAFK